MQVGMRHDFEKFPGEFFSTMGTFLNWLKFNMATRPLCPFNLRCCPLAAHAAASIVLRCIPLPLEQTCHLFFFFSRYAKPHASALSANSTQCGAPLCHDMPPLPPPPKSAQKQSPLVCAGEGQGILRYCMFIYSCATRHTDYFFFMHVLFSCDILSPFPLPFPLPFVLQCNALLPSHSHLALMPSCLCIPTSHPHVPTLPSCSYLTPSRSHLTLMPSLSHPTLASGCNPLHLPLNFAIITGWQVTLYIFI